MRPFLLAFVVALGGCVIGLGPLPPEVESLSDYLERRNFRLVPSTVSYDQAFERVVPNAHVMTYEVTAPEPPSGRPDRALIDVFRFASEDEAATGILGLRRIHGNGAIYADGVLVLYVRGSVPDLGPALTRRYGTALQA